MPKKRRLHIFILQLLPILPIGLWNQSSHALQSLLAKPVASAPTFSPSGGTYGFAQTVSIRSATAGAAIYYSTDGTTPGTSSKKYNGPISVSNTLTLRAMALASNHAASSITTQSYSIILQTAVPLISPPAGSYPAGTAVTLADATPGATIYYTTDGSAPTAASARYSAPIVLASSETITAAASAPGYSSSSSSPVAYTVLPAAASPVFTPTPGSFTASQMVYITDATPGAAIYYTTDGTPPTSASIPYRGPISLSATETICAIAISPGFWPSPPATGTYTLTPPAAIPAITPLSGTYTATQLVAIADSTPGAIVYYTVDGTAPTTSSLKYAGTITASATETIHAMAVAPGYSQSPAAAASYTIAPPAATPSFSPAAGSYTSSQNVTIRDATPNAAIYYTTDGTTPTVASLKYAGPIAVAATGAINAMATAASNSQSAVASATYTITPPAPKPAFTPAAGTYISAPSVSIADSTPGATIYYTTDGTTPSVSSPRYTGPFTVAATGKLSAIALAPGFSQSAIATASYTITPPVATPIFSPAGGSYTGQQSISIADSTPGAAIYYTTDGSAPSVSSTPYNGPVSLSSTLCLHAIAVAPGFSQSAVASAAFSFPAQITIATLPGLPGGFVGAPYTAQITASGGGPDYVWSVNGNAIPGGGSPVVSIGGISFSSNGDYRLAIGGKPKAAGTFTFSVSVTDAYTGDQAGPATFSIAVNIPSAPALPAPTPNTLGPATAHVPYFGYLGAIGGAPPYRWTIAGLPDTLTPVTTTLVSALAGNGAIGFSGDGGPAIEAEIDTGGGLAVDGAGNVYFSDSLSSRVRMISPAGIISTVAGTGTAGYNGDNLPGAQAQLNTPVGLAVDRAGNLYIADSGNARVRMVSAATGQMTTVAGTGAAGYNGENLAAAIAELKMPTGVAVDVEGDLYIADSGNARVREVSAMTGEMTTVAGTGIAAFSGDAGPATKAQLKNPYAVAVDGQGNLYIADLTGAAGATGTSGRIREVSAATGAINTVAGNGTAGYNGDGIAAIKADLSDPIAIAFDSSGILYIADAGNDRVRAVSAGIIRTIAGTGMAGFNGDGVPAVNANLVPQGVAVDSAGDLEIADSGARIRAIPAPAQNSALSIVGTPATAGTITFQASVQDSAGAAAGPVSYTINVSAPLPLALPVPNPGTLPAAVAGQQYSGAIVVSGGVPNYKWYVNGARIPATASPAALIGGLTYSSAGNSLIIGGTPSSPGVVSFQISVTDGMGKTSGPITYSIDIESAPGYEVSGNISFLNCGAPASGIAVAINTSPAQITSTDSSGKFAFENVPAGSYTVTPSSTAPSSVFVPGSQSVGVGAGGLAGIGFVAELGYTVSGSVTLPAGLGGHTYLNLINQNCPETAPGTSVNYSSTFAIRGVQPGTYTLQAWTDGLGNGSQNESSATAVIPNLVVGYANLGSLMVVPAPAAPVVVSSPPLVTAGGGYSGGVFLAYTPIVGGDGLEVATSYVVQWSTTFTFATVAGSRVFNAAGANAANAWFVSGLTNGSVFYFRAQGTVGSSAGPWSPVFGPVTAGPPGGGYSISGSVTFSGSTTSPLYVGFVNQSTGKAYVVTVNRPVSPQAYTVKVPKGASYNIVALIDQNADGIADNGDTFYAGATTGMVSGAMTLNLTLPPADPIAVTTRHLSSIDAGGRSTDSYALQFAIGTTDIVPWRVSLISGPNVLSPLDAGDCSNCGSEAFDFWLSLGPALPQIGDTYTLQLMNPYRASYTVSTATAAVTGVVNAFAANLSPVTGLGSGTAPTFSWTDPPNAADYTYQFTLWDSSGNVIWQIPGASAASGGFSSAITSVAWGIDPTGADNPPAVPSLTAGESYTWSIQVQDANGNTAEMPVSYTP
ncbi:MAG TPA: chitobiase/beta-hexosaminidase C-terminal domain-containing protein [Terracidiphilus sp.]|nr:chitobiase/beta-hexosaminidase C-terminal domain-containing protein [Terracidiphilus sp.]